MRSIVFLILLFPALAWAQYYTPNWRQDVLEMIEDGRKTAARSLLEEAVKRESFISNPIERINHSRFLGDAFYKLNMQERAKGRFESAMKAALGLKPVWKSLSAVISVLELQAESDDRKTSQALIQQSLDARLLPNMAKDRYATEIGRYVQRFEHATRGQVYQLIVQLRAINQERVRKKAFYALTELEFDSFTGEGKYERLTLPMGMDEFERFLWFSVMAKYFSESGFKVKFQEQVNGMQRSYDMLPEEQKTKYRKIYRMVKKLNYEAPVNAKAKKEIVAPKTIYTEEELPYFPPANTELEDLFYGKENAN